MRLRWLTLLVLCALLLGGIAPAMAAPRPSIVIFDSSLKIITVAEAEAGSATTTLSWHVAGMTDAYRLLLHTYVLDKWELVFGDASVPLEPMGARVVTVRHPLNFGPPTFLLSVVNNASNAIVDQRTVLIPYALETEAGPEIAAFSTEVEEVAAEDLQANRAQVAVAWEVLNRPATANLVFEQVFEDGSATSVELPRLNLWIPSVGEGPVAPVYRAESETVTVRLSLVDLITEEVYAEETLELSIAEAPAPAQAPAQQPGAAPAAQSEAAPVPQPQPVVESAEIASFTAIPSTVNPGAAVTLSWEVRGTGGVTIEQRVPNWAQVATVVTAQSPKGSAEVYLPAYAAYSVTFTLWTANRSASRDLTVQVHCPTAFFFGQGDGCPASPGFKVGMSIQQFEGGTMLWRSDSNEIYVFFQDGTAAYFLEQTYAGLPMPELTDMPPLDRQSPSDGFGKVWANAPGVRAKLGWALAAETGYQATIQGVALTRIPRPEFAFYITLPDSSVVGSGYGAWRTVS